MVCVIHTNQPAFASDDARWEAVTQRDPNADGAFYYSVATTGIYCRPNCPSRRARRENVVFHATCAEAGRAGFRPCKRCRPDGPAVSAQHADMVTRACRVIETAEDTPSLVALAASAGLSRYHFHHLFKAATGITPKGYADACRAERLRNALAGNPSFTGAMYDAGYNSNSRFYAHAAARLGMTPSNFRAHGRGRRSVSRSVTVRSAQYSWRPLTRVSARSVFTPIPRYWRTNSKRVFPAQR